jgi:hypothetical protein
MIDNFCRHISRTWSVRGRFFIPIMPRVLITNLFATVDTTIPQYPQTQFRTESLYTVLQTMWKKQTQQSGDIFDQSIAQTFSPTSYNQPLPNSDLLSPLPIGTPGPNVQQSLNNFGQTNNNAVNYDRGQGQYAVHQPQPFAITGGQGLLGGLGQPNQGYTPPPGPPPFTSRKDWIQKSQYLTASLKASTIPSASLPYAWVRHTVVSLRIKEIEVLKFFYSAFRRLD